MRKVQVKSNLRRFGTIQVDIDGLWVLLKNRGYNYSIYPDPIFSKEAIFKFLNVFDTYGIKATFFVVGKDLLRGEKKAIIKEIADRGHEIANHSMSHSLRFGSLSRRDKELEIKDAEEIIQDTIGVKPIGFRAPNFDIDEETMDILEKRGYAYDSSVLPLYCSSLLQILKKVSTNKKVENSKYLNKDIYSFSPADPYHPCQRYIWRKGQRRIIEVPISTIPIFKLPYHSSFVIATYGFMRLMLFYTGFSLTKLMKFPLNYVFHIVDLANYTYDKRLSRFQGLRLTLQKRYKLINSIMKNITENFRILPTQKFIRYTKC